VRDRRPRHRHADQVLASPLGALANGVRHFVGFAETHTHVARAVANHHDRAEGKPPTALHHFGNPVDLDHFFFQRDTAWTYLLLAWHE